MQDRRASSPPSQPSFLPFVLEAQQPRSMSFTYGHRQPCVAPLTPQHYPTIYERQELPLASSPVYGTPSVSYPQVEKTANVMRALQLLPEQELDHELNMVQQVSFSKTVIEWPANQPTGQILFRILPKDDAGQSISSPIVAAGFTLHIVPIQPGHTSQFLNFVQTEIDHQNPSSCLARIICWEAGPFAIQVFYRGAMMGQHPITLTTKIGLVLSGGGSFGAFQVGVLDVLACEKRMRQGQWNSVFGISVGALNGAMLAMHDVGQEDVAISALTTLWRERVKPSAIFKSWCCGDCVHKCGKCGECCGFMGQGCGLVCHKSMLNSTPLMKLVRGIWDQHRVDTSRRHFGVGVANLETGMYECFEKGQPVNMCDAVLASSSFSVYFEPVKMRNAKGSVAWYSDGGLREAIPLRDALRQGCNEIDILFADPIDERRPGWGKGDNFKAFDVLSRMIIMLLHETANADPAQQLTQQGPKRAIKLNIFRPTTPVGADSLDFRPEEMTRRIEIGRHYARTWVDHLQSGTLSVQQHKYGNTDVLLCTVAI
eukprot:gnl/Trimastix_PCT/702.p1 GENE.gnl/Trimastix_PCT/702~~gnl/Trimastix_PCT/702.p1  ORF type:complete len:563 (+),score=90.43 gnl/Trimastix_PCT/702:69-1691(+)